MKESKANRSSLGEGGGSIRAQSAVRQTRLRREAEDLTVVVCPQSKRSAFGAFNSLVGAGVPRLPRFPSTHLVFHVGDIARWFADHSTTAIVSALFISFLSLFFVILVGEFVRVYNLDDCKTEYRKFVYFSS